MSEADDSVVLPAQVQVRLTALAASVLSALPDDQVPASLRRVRAFAPGRRARSGATPLGLALQREPLFRLQVGAVWRVGHPALAAALDAEELPADADPGHTVEGVFLLRPPKWRELLTEFSSRAQERAQERDAEHQDVALRHKLLTAEQEITRLTTSVSAATRNADELTAELAAVRKELRKQRSDADRARAQLRAVEQELSRLTADSTEFEARSAATAKQSADRLRDAEHRLEQARKVTREGRSLAESRLRLLLDTVVEASAALRRELALPPVTHRPADLLAAAIAESDDSSVAARGAGTRIGRGGREPDDPSLLAELLALPQAHLVVDGYNVTKTGYGTLPLLEQRRRLIEGLSALVARTSAEITCCFDGADVEQSGAARVKGVRVLFSAAGTTADALIRQLVRAEPVGRVVVVVSGDGEIVSAVRAAGAHPVPATALLRLLGRG